MKRGISVLLVLLFFGFGFARPACGEETQPEPTQPAAEASPSPDISPEPTVPVTLTIDNASVYEGMEKSYAQGYIPTVQDGCALVVLPLKGSVPFAEDSLRASVELGDDSASPFVSKNYEKTVPLAQHTVKGGNTVESYCVRFDLQLKADRYLGAYPVTVRIAAETLGGDPVREAFTVYVTVADGKDPNATPTPEPTPAPTPTPTEEPVILPPKVLVASCEAVAFEDGAQPGAVDAGQSVRVRITLKNASETQAVENLTVSAASPGDGFIFESPADSVYLGRMEAGAEVEVAYDYTIRPDTPAGQYEIPLSFDFAYGKGISGSGTGTARIEVSQPLRLEFSLLQLPAEAVVSDTVEVNFQAVNLSHAAAYNVRATLTGDGLLPAGDAYIGDLESGSLQQAPMQVRVTGLTGATPYGRTTATVVYRYQDGAGVDHEEEESFTVQIVSPFSDSPTQEPDAPGQWWAVMGAIGGLLLLLGGYLLFRRLRVHRP